MNRLFFVATYGDMGLEVEFFTDPLAYGRAIKDAMKLHERGDLDSYTNGNAETSDMMRDRVKLRPAAPR
ncbi:hypothetical protein Cp1R7AA1_023 [Mesorhizobium phage Cp1R7A-A1]|nr:hypothetical protein Cp1R7AA1_023 [Mesorhizobium phage Cp1R7A-A1]